MLAKQEKKKSLTFWNLCNRTEKWCKAESICPLFKMFETKFCVASGTKDDEEESNTRISIIII